MLDFVEGKVTIPYLLLWERLNTNDKIKLEKMYKIPLNDEQTNWIKLQMKSTNALEDSIKLAQSIGNEAIQSIKDENNQDLLDIMTSMIKRDF